MPNFVKIFQGNSILLAEIQNIFLPFLKVYQIGALVSGSLSEQLRINRHLLFGCLLDLISITPSDVVHQFGEIVILFAHCRRNVNEVLDGGLYSFQVLIFLNAVLIVLYFYAVLVN